MAFAIGGFGVGYSTSAAYGGNTFTAERIIRKALKLLLVPDPSAERLSDGLETLNDLLYSLYTQRLYIYELDIENFYLTAGINSYTYSNTGSLRATRPIKIVSAYLRWQGQDTPLAVGVLKDQARIGTKSTQSQPRTIYYQQSYPQGTVLFDYVPDQNYQLFIHAWKPLISVTALADVIILPIEYNRPLIYNLAIELAPEVNQNVSPELAKSAMESLEFIRDVNGNQAPESDFDDEIVADRYSRSNIYTDGN